MKKAFVIIIVLIALSIGGRYFFGHSSYIQSSQIEKYEECVSEGYSVIPNYPPICITDDGHTFTQKLPPLIVSDYVTLNNPIAHTHIVSPLTLSGGARKLLYEVSDGAFIIAVKDSNGGLLGTTTALRTTEKALHENPTDFIPFSATVSFSKSTTATGTVVFIGDVFARIDTNTSFSIPVYFQKQSNDVLRFGSSTSTH